MRGPILMCGIFGLIAGRNGSPELVECLIDPLTHRGPDDRGTWTDPEARVAFGHRRLAIVDLSPLGRQPMFSSNGRWVITYNGEIYNHRQLRRRLEAENAAPVGGWRGHSDTETLVEAIAAWGLDAALEHAVGMFAFGLWDRKDRKLYLARDRFGEKPLYYGWVGGDFVFGSELKALTAHPRFDNDLSREALATFASRTYVPAPLSIYKRIFKLAQGCILEIAASAPETPRDVAAAEGQSEGALRLRRYWSYGEVLASGLANPIADEQVALEELEKALARSIAGQSMADVPVGAFLSGGIDSSTVVALYQKYSSLPVRSFTIGFDDAHFDEASYAAEVAKHLGTVHHEHYVSAKEAAGVIPRLPTMFDEPFGDSSAIPTFLVSRFARQHVTVVLSGDGGDELFAGYRRHWQALALWNNLRHIPGGARRAGAAAIGRIPFKFWTGVDSLVGTSRRRPFSGKIMKGLRVGASVGSFDELYASYLDQWALEPSPLIGTQSPAPFALDPGFAAPDATRMTYCDALNYLPDDILCKVDRASMAVSLESRVPFLDHRVAEVAARIPMSMKLRGNGGKWIVKQLLGRHVPTDLFDRPKSGFSMPIADWLRGDLRDWAEDLLDASRMRQEGWFDAARIHERWQDTLTGRRNASGSIWSILIFQGWLRSEQERKFAEARRHAA
jgi:asparagine synthase (glutamine-hydrolysing)